VAQKAPADLNAVASRYAWNGPSGEFLWAETGELRAVNEYLDRWTPPYRPVIERGGPRGYSLFLHEHIELQAYAGCGRDPFVEEQQIAGYRSCHSLALLAEHRFLQLIAARQGCRVSLRELVEANPHGDPPAGSWPGDWALMVDNLPRALLSDADRAAGAEGRQQAAEFYRKLGVERVNGHA
jgi:hypothetical protein